MPSCFLGRHRCMLNISLILTQNKLEWVINLIYLLYHHILKFLVGQIILLFTSNFLRVILLQITDFSSSDEDGPKTRDVRGPKPSLMDPATVARRAKYREYYRQRMQNETEEERTKRIECRQFRYTLPRQFQQRGQ